MARNPGIDAAADALARMAAGEPASPAGGGGSGPLSLRRWDSAKTHRLNSAHWQDALEQQPINADLAVDLPTLMARCAHEAANNPILEGVIETHVTDLVGPGGPALQVESDNPNYNAWLEEAWRDWFEMPDIEGVLSGFEMLDQWVRMLWKAGAYLYRQVNDSRAGGDVTLKLRQYHPRKLTTPFDQAGNPNFVNGIESDAVGRIVRYWIDTTPEGAFVGLTTKPEHFDAPLVGHRFRVLEPGQRHGVPLASSALQVIADIRDGDNEILDAIRAAADQGVLLEANNEDAPFINVQDSTTVERRTIKTIPSGWRAKQLQPTQPHTNYLAYRDERIREIGRPIGMPLLMVKGHAGGHNYSSARFDALSYWRNIDKQRYLIQQRDLTPLVRMVERETRLSQLSAGKRVPRPKKLCSCKLIWKWPQPPKLDLQKEWAGLAIKRAIGALSFDDMLNQTERTREEYLAQEKRARAEFEEAGIPYPEADQVLKTILALGDEGAGEEDSPETPQQEGAEADASAAVPA